MELYLRESKENLQNCNSDRTIIIVLGNEACDLDSAVSSLVFAFFLNQTQLFDGLVVPVLNVNRRNLKLHSEVVYYLEETSVNLKDLLCKDEVNIKKFADEKRLKIVLVDHNVLSDEDSYLEPHIIYVIDHHVLEQPQRLQHCSPKVEPVGSCCTLVAEELLSAEPPVMDPQIAMLLYGAILLDTVCLEEKAKRVTQKDKAVVSELEKLLDGITREEVFQALQSAKFDVAGYSPQELLQKDLKVVSTSSSSVAIASVPILLEDFANGESMEQSLVQFSCDNEYHAVILMGSHLSRDRKSIRRQLALFSHDLQLLRNLSEFLMSLEEPSLELVSIPSSASTVSVFEQRNISLTRKFVLPAVRNFLQQQILTDCCNQNISGTRELCSTGIVDAPNALDIHDDVIDGYQTETLDVPDSPHHASLLRIALSTKDIANDCSNTEFQEPNGPLDYSQLIEGQDRASLGSMRKKIPVHPSVLHSDSINDDQKSLSSLSNKSEGDIFSPADDIALADDDEDIDTPEELEISDASVGLKSSTSEPIAEISAAEEYEEERSWKTCVINDETKTIDMKVIEPYKKVLSHGGYHGEARNAIIIFSACYLPNRSRRDYDYVMDNLFLYVLSTLDQLVAEDYILVYLHGATERGSMPSFGWLKRCYQMIDRRLRKNLKGLYLVHPTFWLKTIVIMTRPFVSSKFSRKLKFVNNIDELSSLIPMNDVCIPEKVRKFDEKLLDS